MKTTRNSGLISNPTKQKGATLFTTLVFLTLMTIVSVSATKISMLDILVASNNQQKMVLFQNTSNQLKETATIKNLRLTFTVDGFTGNVTGNDNLFELDGSPENIEEIITDMTLKYPCERQGLGTSIGPNAPPCDLYDFQVRSSLNSSSARDQHNRGAGKMVPNSGSKGSLL